MSKVVVIGNGISGVTFARHHRKNSDDEIIIISGESDYFISRTALMYVYMGEMDVTNIQPYEPWFWKKNRIQLKKAWVLSMNENNKTLKLDDGSSLSYDKLILALGSKPNMFDWPGINFDGISGLYSLQDLELIEEKTKGISKAVVVGGGLIGIELAEMLSSRGIEVIFLVRENSFWNNVLPHEESLMINEEIINHGIDLRLASELSEIIGENGKVSGIKTSEGEVIDCQFVGITIGVSANLGFVKNTSINCNRGILVNEFLETNVKDVYAIGDCAEVINPMEGRRGIEQVWYTGRLMGENLAKNLNTDKQVLYNPGIWFNSAKFFNIEYQTYGIVLPQLNDHQNEFLWQSADKQKLFRVVFDKNSHAVTGVNLFGMRGRHEIWDTWIKNKTTIEVVLTNLEKANFDPEFFKRFEKDIRLKFERILLGQ